MAKGTELKAKVSIGGQVDKSLGKAVKDATGSLGGLKKGFKVVGAVSAASFSAVAAGAATLAVGVAKATKEVYDLGAEFDNAKDTIRIGTGATGEALDALYGDMKDVYKSVPTTLDDAGTAIADYNTRLGLTGEDLSELSKQAIQVSDVLDEDMSSVIEESSQAFKQWNLDSEDMSSAMDYIFKVSQSTGIGFNELMSDMQSSGASLQALGYTFEQSAAMIGNLDKEGINMSQVLSGMQKGLATVAKEGGDATAKMSEYCESIKGAKTESEAISIASEIFGTRAAVTMSQAIRSGAMDVDDLTASLQANSETIAGAAEDTYDLSEKWQLFKQKAQTAIEPVATSVFDFATDALTYVTDAFEEMMPVIEGVATEMVPVIQDIGTQVFPIISDLATNLVPVFGELASGIVPVISEIAGTVIPMISDIATTLVPVISDVASTLAPIFTQLLGDVLPVVTQLVTNLLPILVKIIGVAVDLISSLMPIVAPLLDLVISMLNEIMPIITTVIDAILPVISDLIAMIVPIIQELAVALTPIIQMIANIVSTILPPLVTIIQTVLIPIIQNVLVPLFQNVLGVAIQNVTNAISSIQTVCQGIADFIGGIFSGNWEQVWTGICEIFNGIWNGLTGLVTAPINWIIGAVNGVIDIINDIGFTIPDWVPVIGGKEFALNIPEIPLLATGGFTDGVSIAGEAGTEAVISFDPSVRNDNLNYWAKAGVLLGLDNDRIQAALNGTVAGGTGSTSYYSIEKDAITFAPTVKIDGNANKEDVLAALIEAEEEFIDLLDEYFSDDDDDGEFVYV